MILDTCINLTVLLSLFVKSSTSLILLEPDHVTCIPQFEWSGSGRLNFTQS